MSLIVRTLPIMTTHPRPRGRGSPTRQLAELILNQPIQEWITARRAEGLSWRSLERELYRETDGRVNTTYETIRKWANE